MDNFEQGKTTAIAAIAQAGFWARMDRKARNLFTATLRKLRCNNF